jgi:hypothetical protein
VIRCISTIRAGYPNFTAIVKLDENRILISLSVSQWCSAASKLIVC